MRLSRLMGAGLLLVMVTLALAAPVLADDPQPAASAGVALSSFVDQNDSGLRDSGEQSVAGGTVTLTDETGKLVAEMALGESGGSLGGLAAGTYSVSFEPGAGYVATGSARMTVALSEGVMLKLAFPVKAGAAASAPKASPPKVAPVAAASAQSGTGFGATLYRFSGILVALVALALPLGVRMLRRG